MVLAIGAIPPPAHACEDRALASEHRNRIHRRAGHALEDERGHRQHELPAAVLRAGLSQLLQVAVVDEPHPHRHQADHVQRVADARIAKPAAGALRRPADASERDALIRLLEQQMQAAAEELDFELAAVLRDQLLELKADAPFRERAQPVR